MLAQLGALQFETIPFSMDRNTLNGEAGFAEHPVVGRTPDLEFVGDGLDVWTVSGKLRPDVFGGLSELQTLQSIMRSGQPQPWMRGDGFNMGWVVVTGINVTSTYIAPNGVGRVVEFETTLKRSDMPGIGGAMAILTSLF